MNPVIWEIVRDITAECFGIPSASVMPATHFVEDLDESLHVVEIIMDVEERFGIHLDDDTWSTVQTVGDMAVIVERYVGHQWPHTGTVWPPAPRIPD